LLIVAKKLEEEFVRRREIDAGEKTRQKLGGWEGALDRRVEANQTGRGSVGQARLRELMDGTDSTSRPISGQPQLRRMK